MEKRCKSMIAKERPGMLHYMSVDDDVDNQRVYVAGGGKPEPRWKHFWDLVPSDTRSRIEVGELKGREAILSCVQKSGTIIEDLSHPLAGCLTETEREMLRTRTGTITIGMSNGYKIVNRRQ
jgi:hypothetical protein